MKNLIKSSVLVAVLAAGIAGPASAQKRQESVHIWWDSEDHNYIVGQRVQYCDGTAVRVGNITMYDEDIYYGCS